MEIIDFYVRIIDFDVEIIDFYVEIIDFDIKIIDLTSKIDVAAFRLQANPQLRVGLVECRLLFGVRGASPTKRN